MLADCIRNVTTEWKPVLEKIAETHGNKIDKMFAEHEKIFKDTLEILPPENLVFNAFNHHDPKNLKVVIIGQDVYPNKKNAMGLSFSVPADVPCAASLKNIFKEIENEYGVVRTNNDLTDWARQGVLLLNVALTVRETKAASHLAVWKPYTTEIIRYINENHKNIVYILWGNYAKEFASMIDANENLILTGIHPSPLASSRGNFVGNGHFKAANDYLKSKEKFEIAWV